MAEEGWKLVKTSRWGYKFEACQRGAVCQEEDFVADKSFAELKEYEAFLEGLGMRVFTKNLNLGKYSIGEVRLREKTSG